MFLNIIPNNLTAGTGWRVWCDQSTTLITTQTSIEWTLVDSRNYNAKSRRQCLGRFLGIIDYNPSVFKSNRLHVVVFFKDYEVYSLCK